MSRGWVAELSDDDLVCLKYDDSFVNMFTANERCVIGNVIMMMSWRVMLLLY